MDHGIYDVQDEQTIYKARKKDLRNLIRKSKERVCGKMCEAVENDPWGLPY